VLWRLNSAGVIAVDGWEIQIPRCGLNFLSVCFPINIDVLGKKNPSGGSVLYLCGNKLERCIGKLGLCENEVHSK